jgi:hypothetical protein
MSGSVWTHPLARLGMGLLMAPFFLQLLGLGKTPLGGGLCGDLLGQDQSLALQNPLFWYAAVFMILLGFQLAYGAFLLLAGLIQIPPESAPRIFGLAWGLAALMGILFILTRFIGVPAPSGAGWVLERAPLDGLSLVLVGLSLVGGLLLRQVARA